MSDSSIRSSSRRRRQIMPKLKTPSFSSEDDDEEDNDDNTNKNEFVCNDCGSEFGTQVGLSVHQSRWCKGSKAKEEEEEEEDENEEEEEEEEEGDDVADDGKTTISDDDDVGDEAYDDDVVVNGNNKKVVVTTSTQDEDQDSQDLQDSQDDDDSLFDNEAAFELHYYVFNLLYMIGFMLHCRKYIDYNIVITMIHILFFISTSSSTSSMSSMSTSSSSNSTTSSSSSSSTLIFLNKIKIVFHELTFTSFLGFVIYTTYDTSPFNANHHNVMGILSMLLLPQQLKRFLVVVTVQLPPALLFLQKKSSSGDSHNKNTKKSSDTTSTSTTSARIARIASQVTTKDGLNSARIAIIIMYFMAGFHKINTDFLFNPKVSCAYDMMWKYLPLINIDDLEDLEPYITATSWGVMKYLPFMALFVELVPPILLAIPSSKIQKLGIGMLLLLHLLLLPTGFVDFGSIAQSFLWLFISPTTIFGTTTDSSASNTTFQNFMNDIALCLCFLEFCAVVCTWQFDYTDPPFIEEEFGMVLMSFFIMWSYIIRRIILVLNNTTGNTTTGTGGTEVELEAELEAEADADLVRIYIPKSIITKCSIFLFLFYTMNPYLGLRTTGCVNMFSNLRTEGLIGNHLLLGSNRIKFWSYQEDIITILDWDDRAAFYLSTEHVHLDSNYYKDEYDLYDKPVNVYMKYLYQGVIYETIDLYYCTTFYKQFIVDMENYGDLQLISPWYIYKYFDFRDIQPDYNDTENSAQECVW
ncbi:hypothetical protein FRACYDRAFT_238563 [Fragilariopsis cylindrus CCMP1102]|uniref:C2H2-type domain-containing protein n=1 Tax=Fragilariopsis cylindrus CCMP1102 TaxID=635003 RepID=A0A1E7FIW9_9STRA|nr:hypothetical protein FRACYDRAFT_238563 [Fragilariopsis cylindrus CCMP1102]|eukprot:OEU18129.1 hypothetical protein FRACYDRAFT_238563 [Fragilariopsis cylindrus CCMP1102]